MTTIFTPTYNRASLLQRLYESLCLQTNQDFEWLVVDDGSSDATKEVLQQMQQEAKIKLRYFMQQNGGKHRAINRGLKEAAGDYFFIVDSDDFIAPDTIAVVEKEMIQIRDLRINSKAFSGISMLCTDRNGAVIGGAVPYEVLDASVFDFRYVHNIAGDKAEVFFTNIIRQFPFPEVPEERFCPEALVWNRMAKDYLMRNLNKKQYVREYQPEGLTSKIFEIRKQCPVSTTTYYGELADAREAPLSIRIRSILNYWRFSGYLKDNVDSYKFMSKDKLLKAALYPMGVLLRVNDKIKK